MEICQLSERFWDPLDHEQKILGEGVKKASPEVRQHLAVILLFCSLSMIGEYESLEALELLDRTVSDWLQPFERLELSNYISDVLGSLEKHFQALILMRKFFELCGGILSTNQHLSEALNIRPTENARVCCGFLKILCQNPGWNFEPGIRQALSKSKLFLERSAPEWKELIAMEKSILKSVHIGYPYNYLNVSPSCTMLSSQLQNGMTIGDMLSLRSHLKTCRRWSKVFENSANTVPLILIGNSRISEAHSLLKNWIRSDEGLALYKSLITDTLECQNSEQLGLSLAALFCYGQLDFFKEDQPHGPMKGNFLYDFHQFLCDPDLSNQRTVLESMIFSFTNVWQKERNHEELMVELLLMMEKETNPWSNVLDAATDLYWHMRLLDGFNHLKAYQAVQSELRLAMSPMMEEKTVQQASEENGFTIVHHDRRV